MLRLSRLTDYAIILLSIMVVRDKKHGNAPAPKLFSAPEMAECSFLPLPVVAKILKHLCRDGVIASKRGASGGYYLARTPQEISVAEVIAAVDGPVSLTACVEGSGEECGTASICPMHGRWQPVNDAVKGALSQVSLDQIIADDSVPKAFSKPHDGIETMNIANLITNKESMADL